MSTSKQGRDKFQARAVPCMFLGYPCGKKAYKVMALDSYKFYTSRDVVFHENIFPFSVQTPKTMFPQPPTPTSFELPPFEPQSSSHVDITEDEHTLHNNLSPQTQHLENNVPSASPPQTRKSDRIPKTPQYLKDYICSASTELYCFFTLTNLNFQPPTLPVHCLTTANQTHLANLDFTEPQTFEKAPAHPGWLAAMEAEL